MRSLLVLPFLALSFAANAAPSTYDIYLQACDQSTDCVRVADFGLGPNGAAAEASAQGINIRVDTIAMGPDTATVRLTLNLVPRQLAYASLGTRQESAASRFGFQVEPCTMQKGHFVLLGVFSGGNKVYQVWGRLSLPHMAPNILAAR
jgi:hypothetical protein